MGWPRATTRSAAETAELGCRLAEQLRPGHVVALYGDMGAGKTCLIQGICRGLGVMDAVTSPTFVLVNEYRGRCADGSPVGICHFDLYRIRGPEELLDLGWDDYLARGGLCLLEWADRAAGLLPTGTIAVRIEAPEPALRHFTVVQGE